MIRSLVRSGIRSPIRSVINNGQVGGVVSPDPGPSSIADLFANGEYGAWYDISDTSTLYQDSGGTTPVTSGGDPVGLVQDKSGNGANAVQTVSAARPVYNVTPDRLTLDKVDDNMSVALASPVAGSMIMKLNNGIIVAEIDASGSWEFTANPSFFPDNGISDLIVIDRVLTPSEIDFVKSKLGGQNEFSDVTNMSTWFRGRSDLTALNVDSWDTSSVTTFERFAQNASNIGNLDVSNWDTSSSFSFRWFIEGTSIKNLDISNWDTSSVTSFSSFAFLAPLETLTINGGTGNPFADSSCIDYGLAFYGTNLTQQSIDDILVAIEAAGTSNGIFGQSGGSAPSATGEAAIDALRGRGWTINVTGGY